LFFALMVGALEPLAQPPRGPVVYIFCVDGGRSQTSVTSSQGSSSMFFALMVALFNLRHHLLGAHHQHFLR
jgi:hypothetical protein